MSNGSPRNRVVLVVLDGWGYRREREGNAIELAPTPVWHRLWGGFPRTLLDASGLAVGLPGLDLGAGRQGDERGAVGIAMEIGGVLEPPLLLRPGGSGEEQKGHHAGW